MNPTDEQYIATARRLWLDEGQVEIGDPADEPVMVSRGDDEEEGAYVRAWVWVPIEEALPAEAPQRGTASDPSDPSDYRVS